MLRICAPLDDDRPRGELAAIDERQCGGIGGQFLDQCCHIFWQSWPSIDGVEVAEPGDKRIASHARMDATHG